MRGHIRKHRAGYQVTIHLGYDENGKRIRYRKTLKTKKLAEEHCRHKLNELATEGTLRTKSLDSLEAYLKRWLEVSAKPRLRARTFEDYADTLRRYVFDTPLGRKPLSTITPADIQEAYGKIQLAVQARGRGTGATTIKYLHAILRSALNQAVKWRELTQNPALFVDRPKVRRKEKVIFQPEDFPAFMRAALEEKRNGLLWVCALLSGARPEEYLAWQWPDINWRTCEVRTVRALVRPRKRKPGEPAWRFEPVKTGNGRRVIVFDEEVMFLLRRHQAEQAEEKLAAHGAYEDNGLVFCNELGGPLHQHNLSQRVFPRVIERAGLSPDLTPYSLRHSCATGLLDMGEDIGQVSHMLGHSSSYFTFDTYVAKRPLKGAASKLGRAMFGDRKKEGQPEVGPP